VALRLGPAAYQHWGAYYADTTSPPRPEPNDLQHPEYCGLANASQAYTGGTGRPRAWGWADAGCNSTFAFMCRAERERPIFAAAAADTTASLVKSLLSQAL
jgi:hypothetical protein